MEQTSDVTTELLPVIFLGIYWAYLLIWHESQKPTHGDRHSVAGPTATKIGAEARNNPERSSVNRTTVVEFDEVEFTNGARRAYELILGGFISGRLDHIGHLLGPDVYDAFSDEIGRRGGTGHVRTLKFVTPVTTEIVDKQIEPDMIAIAVRFEADLFVSLESAATTPAAASSTHLHPIDLWTFQKARHSSDPTWLLVATDSE